MYHVYYNNIISDHTCTVINICNVCDLKRFTEWYFIIRMYQGAQCEKMPHFMARYNLSKTNKRVHFRETCFCCSMSKGPKSLGSVQSSAAEYSNESCKEDSGSF